MKKEKTFFKFGLLLCVLAVVIFAVACGNKDNTQTDQSGESAAVSENVKPESNVDVEVNGATGTVIDVGVGEKSFQFEVTLDDKTEKFTVHTDETTVGDALLGAGLITGEESDLGLFVTSVNGITLDYDKDGKFWGFFIDGEMAMTGVDATDIDENSIYAFVATEG
ncbi:MAG: DUF4430 domain-containing protein [Lachnospiraceae bacterium]|jgi:hypothetical protein|nr:DUF4430 domain-containing protein [Lachnospiraceae bacterium]